MASILDLVEGEPGTDGKPYFIQVEDPETEEEKYIQFDIETSEEDEPYKFYIVEEEIVDGI